MKPYKNVYSAEEYKQLQELNEAALEQNKILKRQLDEAKDKQKVVLPRDVAEAIEKCRNTWAGFSDNSVFGFFLDINKFDDSGVGLAIKKFALVRPLDYMKALVNGYTVEQTPAEKLHAKVEELIYGWIGSPVDEMDAEEIHRLADRIVERAEEILS